MNLDIINLILNNVDYENHDILINSKYRSSTVIIVDYLKIIFINLDKCS